MMSERATYQLRCPQCGLTGKADWSEIDGPAFLRARARGDETTWVDVSDGFTWQGKAPDGPTSFFGRYLTCTKCEVQADAHAR
jgi:hypothetical protein